LTKAAAGHAATGREPVALTIAGSDCSGGAGIQADLKTFTALGVYGASVLTALTAQNTMGVSGVLAVPEAFIAAQAAAVTRDLDVRAVKTGMLGDRATVGAVVTALAALPGVPLVVDPVMVATSGDLLLAPDAIEAVRRDLLPLAAVATPNLDEAARLLDARRASSVDEAEAQALAILGFGCRAVLLKGGHGTGDQAVDVLAKASGATRRLALPRIATGNTHGTGCTLSAAITALIACGHDLDAAVERAKSYVWQGLRSGAALTIGAGAGPIDQMFAIRRRPVGL